jgi:hypothetical protein
MRGTLAITDSGIVPIRKATIGYQFSAMIPDFRGAEGIMVSIQILTACVQKRRQSGERRPGGGGLRDSFESCKELPFLAVLRGVRLGVIDASVFIILANRKTASPRFINSSCSKATAGC